MNLEQKKLMEASPSPQTHRRNLDVNQLMSNREVTLINGLNKFDVKFFGPKDTLYEGGIWKIRVELPEKYPNHPPFLRFVNEVS